MTSHRIFSRGIADSLSLICVSLILGLVAVFCVPKAYYDETFLGGRPVYQYFFAMLVFAAGLWFPFGRRGNVALWLPLLVGVAAVGLATVFWFPSSHAIALTIVYDLSAMAGVICGIIIGLNLAPRLMANTLIAVHITCVVSLILSIRLLETGVIAPMENNERVYDQAMFFASAIITFVLPVAIETCLDRRHIVFAWFFWGISFVSCAWFANMSATRSVIVITAISALIGAFRLVRGAYARIGLFLLLGISCLIVGGPILSRYFSNLGWRITGDGYVSGARFGELASMFDQVNWKLSTGIGIGGAFYSDITWEGNPDGLDWAPHIAIVTPLLKGGIVALLAIVLWPAYTLARQIVARETQHMPRAYLFSILVYLVQTTISGGYHYGPLLILGLLIGSYQRQCQATKIKVRLTH